MNTPDTQATASGLRTDSSRNAVLALVLLVPAPTVGVLAGMWFLPGMVGQSIYFLSKAWIIALPVLWLLKVDRGRPSWSLVTGWPPETGRWRWATRRQSTARSGSGRP